MGYRFTPVRKAKGGRLYRWEPASSPPPKIRLPLSVFSDEPSPATQQLSDSRPTPMSRPLEELLNVPDPAWPLVQEWLAKATNAVGVLEPPPYAAKELEAAQVTLRSPMGAIVYHTGGLLVDHGWLRILGGGGHPRMKRSLMGWNRTRTFDEAGNSRGFLLVADDILGGFFAINGGALGADVKNIYYFAPDTLRWESLELGYTDFITFCFAGKIADFYGAYRWDNWQEDTEKIVGDEALSIAPPLWTKEGKDPARSHRAAAPVSVIYDLNVVEFPRQLGP